MLEGYGYDGNDNRTTRRFGTDPPEAATYDAQDRLLTRGAVAYQVDDDGFLAGRGPDTFSYTVAGELAGATVGGQAVTYAYDGTGQVVSRTRWREFTRPLPSCCWEAGPEAG